MWLSRAVSWPFEAKSDEATALESSEVGDANYHRRSPFRHVIYGGLIEGSSRCYRSSGELLRFHRYCASGYVDV